MTVVFYLDFIKWKKKKKKGFPNLSQCVDERLNFGQLRGCDQLDGPGSGPHCHELAESLVNLEKCGNLTVTDSPTQCQISDQLAHFYLLGILSSHNHHHFIR